MQRSKVNPPFGQSSKAAIVQVSLDSDFVGWAWRQAAKRRAAELSEWASAPRPTAMPSAGLVASVGA